MSNDVKGNGIKVLPQNLLQIEESKDKLQSEYLVIGVTFSSSMKQKC